METDKAVNAVSEEVVNPQAEENAELKAEVSGSVNSAVATEPEVPKPEETKEEKPKQSAEENARFAEVRRKAEQEARDKTVREMAKQFGWDGIDSWEAYQKAIQAEQVKKEAEEKGVDPDFLSEVKEKERKLAEYEKKEERTKMYLRFRETFPEVDYKEVTAEIWKKVEDGEDLTSLYAIHAYKKSMAEVAEKQKITETNEANAQASTGSVAGKGDTDIEYFTQSEFDNHRGDKNWIIKNYDKIMKSVRAKKIQQ